MKWYCHIKGQQYGPVDEATLRGWISEGRVMPADLVWAEGMENWVKAESVFSAAANDLIPGTGGNTPCKEIRAMARRALAGKWGTCAFCILGLCGIAVAFNIVLQIFVPLSRYNPEAVSIIFAALCLGLFLSVGAFYLGFFRFFLDVVRGKTLCFGTFFSGFKYFWGAFALCFCVALFTMLWSLLLVIPGIMASYSYAMAYYVYADNPELGALGAIRRSKEMMYGHRLKLFWLGLTFIGWSILSVFTCNIGLLWLIPYMQASFAVFYHDIQQPRLATASQTTTPSQPTDLSGGTMRNENDTVPDLSKPLNPQQ